MKLAPRIDMKLSTEQKATIGKKSDFACGIQSLPWLILTDKAHIVQAEGLGLAELDIAIKRTNK